MFKLAQSKTQQNQVQYFLGQIPQLYQTLPKISHYDQGSNINMLYQMFQKVTEAFKICIKRAEQRTLSQIIKVPPSFFGLKFQDLQIQQLYGISQSCLHNTEFLNILGGEDLQKISQQIKKRTQQLEMEIQSLGSSIVININHYGGKLKAISPNKLNILPQILKQQYRHQFSSHYKSELLSVSDSGFKIRRTGNMKNGLTVYAITDQPLNKGNQLRDIVFKITQQKHLYMYFGSFKKFNFEGRVYENGNKMYAIRQNGIPKKCAVTLHNSLEYYSNRQVVLWDLQLGDQLRLHLQVNRKSVELTGYNLVLTKNEAQKFVLPLDEATTEFYPFVGMKYDNDQIAIVDKNNSYKLDGFRNQQQPQKLKKSEISKPGKKKIGGFLGLF